MADTCEKLFNSYNLEEHTNSLVAYLPGGDLFEAKNDPSSVMRRLFAGLAGPIKQADDVMNDLTYQYDINCTTDLISEWEHALGIPDECFPGTGDIETRRQHVLIKLASLGVSTAKGFVDLAALFGFTAEVKTSGSGFGIFPLDFPAAFFQYPQEARFTLYIILDSANVPEVFPFETTKFPIPFFSDVSNIIECLFNKLKPANVTLIMQYLPLS
jgi:uncharacterized protein YmfQ (DUF2313 family)